MAFLRPVLLIDEPDRVLSLRQSSRSHIQDPPGMFCDPPGCRTLRNIINPQIVYRPEESGRNGSRWTRRRLLGPPSGRPTKSNYALADNRNLDFNRRYRRRLKSVGTAALGGRRSHSRRALHYSSLASSPVFVQKYNPEEPCLAACWITQFHLRPCLGSVWRSIFMRSDQAKPGTFLPQASRPQI